MPSNENLECKFCGKSYKSESRLMTHRCKQKERWIQKDEKFMKLGFAAFNRFYSANMAGKSSRNKSYEDFINSRYFNGFVEFGKYLVKIHCIDPQAYIEFVCTSGLPLDKWSNDRIYYTWVREQSKLEDPVKAVERMLLLMTQWSMETGNDWVDFFRKIAPPLAVSWIETGRISPWVLYVAPSAEELFSRFSPEQLAIIKDYLNPEYWTLKIRQHEDDVSYIVAVLKEAGV